MKATTNQLTTVFRSVLETQRLHSVPGQGAPRIGTKIADLVSSLAFMNPASAASGAVLVSVCF